MRRRYEKPDRPNPPSGLLAGVMEYGVVLDVIGKYRWDVRKRRPLSPAAWRDILPAEWRYV